MNTVLRRDMCQYGFSPDKQYDFVIQMLKSYSTDEYQSLCRSRTIDEPPIFACRFARAPGSEHILALANEDGKIGIQNTTSSSRNSISCNRGHINAIFDVAWADSKLWLVSVSGDHSATLWDVCGSKLTPLGLFEGHTRSVKVVAFKPQDSNTFATGARDGMIMVWDYRVKHNASFQADIVIANGHSQGLRRQNRKNIVPSRAESITGLTFQNENNVISCSAGDGMIKVWDIRKCYLVNGRVPQACYCLPYPGTFARNGFTSLSVDPGRIKLFANCMDNNIYCYNISTYERTPVATYSGHQNNTFYVKSCLSGDGKYLLSGSSDENAYVWNVKQPGQPLACLKGHTAEVTCVDWASNIDGDIKLVTCADDSCHRIWRLRPPTDDNPPVEQVSGWVDIVSKVKPKDCINTPCSMRRRIRQQERTPRPTGSVKRLKMDETTSEQDRSILAAVQPSNSYLTPRRLFDHASERSGSELMSPTSNLPNYVMEGTSPRHRCSSATKHKENWLMKLQTTPSPKQSTKVTPKRKIKTGNASKACGNLLQFFRVASKESPPSDSNADSTCEGQDDESK